MLLARLASAAVLVPLILAVAWAGRAPFVIVVALVAAWCAAEYSLLVERMGLRPAWPVAIIGAGALSAAPAVPESHLGALALIVAILGPGLYYLADGTALDRAMLGWGTTTLPTVLLGFCFAQANALRGQAGLDVNIGPIEVERGAALVLVALTATWASDTLGYATGRLVGRRPFFPHISPRKTVEGAVAAVVAPSVVGGLWAPVLAWPIVFGVVLGAAAGTAAVTGDLLESALKRVAGAKDAGTLIPGHGGLLDRVDSQILVLVTVATLTGAVWP